MQIENGQSVFIAAHNGDVTNFSEDNEVLQDTGVNKEIKKLMDSSPWSKGNIVEFPGKEPGMHLKAESEVDVARYNQVVSHATVFRHSGRLLCKLGSSDSHISVETADNAHLFTTRMDKPIDTTTLNTVHVEAEVEII